MAIRSVDDLRAKAGEAGKSLSDEDLITSFANHIGEDPSAVANNLGYKAADSGKTSNRFGTAIDRYQAGLYGLGEAITGSEWMGERRRANELEADVYARRAKEQGAVESYKDVHGVADAADYVAGLAIQSAPYLAESLAGGIAGRAVMGGTKAALRGAIEAGDVAAATTARQALNRGATMGATAASYPSAVADVLGNQREQSGTTDLAVAAALGVPYAALNAFGVEGALAKRQGFRNTMDMLDNVSGIKGGIARAGVTGTKVGVAEGLSETAQEGLNQLGRMSVDPNEAFLTDASKERFTESFIGGAALGGVGGVAGGGWRRSQAGSVLKDVNNSGTQGGTETNALNTAIDSNSPEVTTTAQVTAPVIQVTPSGDALVTPTQQQAYQDFGQTQLGIKAQQEAAAKQQEEQIVQTAKTFGATPAPVAGAVDIAGKRVFGSNAVNAFMTELNQAVANDSNLVKTVKSAIVRSGLANIKDTGTVKQLVNNINKIASTYQIAEAQTVEQVAEILNNQIGRLEGASALKEAEKVNSIYSALTGQAAPEFVKIQEAVAAQEAAKTTKGNKDERLQLQQQGNAGLRAVSKQGGTTETSGATVGDVRPTSVQPVQSGSVGAGPSSVQVGSVPGEGVSTSTSANVTGANRGGNQAQGQVNEAKPTTSQVAQAGNAEGRRGDTTETEAEIERKQTLAEQVVSDILQIVIVRKGKMKAENVSKFRDFIRLYEGGVKNADTLSAIAERMGITKGMAKEWNRKAKTFVDDNVDALAAAMKVVSERYNLTMEQIFDLIPKQREIENAAILAEEGQFVTKPGIEQDFYANEDRVSKGELDRRELGSEEGGMSVLEGRTGASIQEIYNAPETINAKLLKNWEALIVELEQAQEDLIAARSGEDNELVTSLEAKVAKLEQAVVDNITSAETDATAKETKRVAKAEAEKPTKKKREKVKNAVQKPSTKEVPVREGAGSSEGVRKEDTEKREVATESKAEEKALTPAEEAEAAWNKLAAVHGIPTYDTLSEKVKEDWMDSVASGNAKLKDAQVVFEKSQETKTVSEEKLDDVIAELPKAQIQALEKHYGVSKDSNEFFDKVKEDVVNYINKGATAVAGAVRSIIKAIAEGVLAMAVVFNPSINKPADFNLPEFMKETRTVTAEAPAAANMTDVAKRAYSVSAPTFMKANQAFFIADKPNGKVHLFDNQGKHVASSDALYGKTEGDTLASNIIEKKVDQLLDMDKVTPAGTYTLQVQPDPEYTGGYTLRLFDGKNSLGGIAIHSVYLGDAKENRPARLLSKDLKDKKISYGCINTTQDFFVNKIMPRMQDMQNAGVVVIPDAQDTLDKYLKPTTVTETTKTATSKGVTKLEGTKEEIVAKEENIQASKSQDVGGSTKSDVQSEIKEFLGRTNSRVLNVVQSITDLPAEFQAALSDQERVGGFVTRQGKAYLVADNIAPGNARAVFMHEVGSHLGLQEMLSASEFDTLVDKVVEWSKDPSSVEGTIANKAMERVSAAKVGKTERNTELIAYFIEEAVKAGITPTIMAGGVRPRSYKIVEWLRKVKQAFEKALNKLGMGGIDLNAQDMVDLAYGAAHIVMKNAPTVSRSEVEIQKSVQAFEKARAQAQSTIDKLPPSMRAPVRGIWSALFNAKEAALSAMITKDVVEMAEKYMPSAANFLRAHELRTQITREHEQHLSKIKVAFDKLDEATGKKVNDLIADSTTKQEWAFDPGIDKAKVNDALNKRFNALPTAAQQIVKDVFMSSRKDLKNMQQTVREAVDNAFAEKMAAATTPEEQKAVEKEKAKMLKGFSGILDINNITPYAPLKRFGSFVVVAKSQQYRDAEANKDTKEIEKLQADENHFIVEFAETAGEAEEIYDKLAARNQYAELERPFKKSAARESLYSGTDLFKGFAKLKRVIAAEKGESAGNEVLTKLESMVNELYLISLADSSARKAQLQRKNISGFDRDMMRAFFTQSTANAHYMANLKTSDAVLDSVVAMQKEAGNNRAAAYPFLNELMMREAQSLETREPSMLDAANRLTSDWFLTFSPSFYLQQATQTYVLTLPWLAGKYKKGYKQAASEIFKAYQDVLPIVKGIDLKEHVDLSTAPADVREMLKTLVGRGRIDIGVEVETAGHRSEKGNIASATYNKVANTMRGAINRLETINRATAAIAAYRMEMAVSGNKEKALEAADQAVHVTHGSYDGFNTPRIFGKSGLTRSIFQFRRFQVIQLSMLARMMNKAFVNGSKEEKAVARKQLAFLVSHMMVLGGMKGMPFYVIGSFAFNLIKGLFGDSDDPEDFEEWLRKHGGVLLARGVPAWMGLDVSGKLGMGNVLSVLPYTEVDLTSRGGIEKTALGAMGPFIGGLLPKMADGAGLVARGDYYKGLEQMLPNGVSNAMKGIRFATEGVTLRNGDVVVPPEEISFGQAIMQGLGLPTSEITERTYAQGQVKKMDKYYHDRESEVKYQYTKAYKAGDSAGLAAAREDWNLIQQSKREQSIKPSPMSELIKAPMAQQKRERSVIGGIETNRGNRQMVRDITER